MVQSNSGLTPTADSPTGGCHGPDSKQMEPTGEYKGRKICIATGINKSAKLTAKIHFPLVSTAIVFRKEYHQI